jgi:hypothetical protein
VVRSARFIFLALHDPDRSRSPSWGRNADPDPARRAGAPAVCFAWLLASPNNRELGRSFRVWDSYAAGRSDVGILQQGVDQLETSMATDTATGMWTWRVTLGDRPVARSGRMYHRERECRYSLRTFLAAVPGAQLVDGVRQVEGRGRHDRQSSVGSL